MSTAYSVFYNKFFYKIEKDKDFFNYYRLSSDEAMILARERSKNYLKESLAKLTLESTNDVDFNDYDDILETVNIDCTNTEQDIIANLMFEMYLSRDIAKLNVFAVSFTPTDLKVFSPAEERKSFVNMYDSVVLKNTNMIDAYNSRDRLTGKRKIIDYTKTYEV